jgi:hypothetical protein
MVQKGRIDSHRITPLYRAPTIITQIELPPLFFVSAKMWALLNKREDEMNLRYDFVSGTGYE